MKAAKIKKTTASNVTGHIVSVTPALAQMHTTQTLPQTITHASQAVAVSVQPQVSTQTTVATGAIPRAQQTVPVQQQQVNPPLDQQWIYNPQTVWQTQDNNVARATPSAAQGAPETVTTQNVTQPTWQAYTLQPAQAAAIPYLGSVAPLGLSTCKFQLNSMSSLISSSVGTILS